MFSKSETEDAQSSAVLTGDTLVLIHLRDIPKDCYLSSKHCCTDGATAMLVSVRYLPQQQHSFALKHSLDVKVLPRATAQHSEASRCERISSTLSLKLNIHPFNHQTHLWGHGRASKSLHLTMQQEERIQARPWGNAPIKEAWDS